MFLRFLFSVDGCALEVASSKAVSRMHETGFQLSSVALWWGMGCSGPDAPVS